MQNNIGKELYSLVGKLFPICRSITGNGNRKTLAMLKEVYSDMNIYEIPTGTEAFDWVIPREWNINDAWIKNENGEKIIDFQNNNLHVVGYSEPVDKVVELEELLTTVYSLPKQPEVIPYVTSYYRQCYGFCMSDEQKRKLTEQKYHVYIDSELKDGYLTYGEIIIPGKTEEEIFLSTYICHPSMANNELSGPSVAIYLAKWISELKDRKYTYRIIFVPETIGSITYIRKNIKTMQRNIIAGFNLTCLGDDRTFSYIPSRYGNTLSDRVAKNVLFHYYPNFKEYSFLDRGSDERQYCAPGVDLPVCSICRSKYGEYPEYHTSADDLSLVSEDGLEKSFILYQQCILILEENAKYKVNCLCEPQLSKRGLYPTLSSKDSGSHIKEMMDTITYLDGKNDLIDISNITGINPLKVIEIIKKLDMENLISIVL